MTTYLLDTSVIIDVLNAKRQRDVLLRQLLLDGNLLACCAINVTEVYAGMRTQEKPQTKAFIESLDYFGITREVAGLAGQLKRDWADKGITLSVSDVTIAAVVLSNKLVLMTDNVRHYPMPDLRRHDL